MIKHEIISNGFRKALKKVEIAEANVPKFNQQNLVFNPHLSGRPAFDPNREVKIFESFSFYDPLNPKHKPSSKVQRIAYPKEWGGRNINETRLPELVKKRVYNAQHRSPISNPWKYELDKFNDDEWDKIHGTVGPEKINWYTRKTLRNERFNHHIRRSALVFRKDSIQSHTIRSSSPESQERTPASPTKCGS